VALEMTEIRIKRSKLIFAPLAALVIGGLIFGFGYSLRPMRNETAWATAATDTTGAPAPGAGPVNLHEVTKPRFVSLVHFPDSREVDPDQVKTRSGIIVSMNGELFILRDEQNDTWYHLDDQKTAGAFLGKKVRVIGEVDPATDVIHVERIEEAKA
jgi:hypothetical protein